MPQAEFELRSLVLQASVLIITPDPPVSEASMDLPNLTERKNSHTPFYGVIEFVRLSVCLLQTLTPIILGLAKQNGLNFFSPQPNCYRS